MPSLLKKTENEDPLPRVITVSSTAHRSPKNYEWTMNLFKNCIESEDFMNGQKNEYDRWLNYGISKSCNILFTRELQKRYNSQLIAVSCHPGGVQTGLSRHMDFTAMWHMLTLLLFNPSFYYENFKTISQGAATTLRCVSLDDSEIKQGHYYANCNDANDQLKGVSAISLNDKGILCTKLWQLSELLVTSKGFSLRP